VGRRKDSGILIWMLAVSCAAGLRAGEWDALLDRLETGSVRMGEPSPKSMTVLETLKDLDGDGLVKSLTEVTKRVEFRDSTQNETVLKAVRTEDGKTRDVTGEWVEKSGKEKRSRERKSAEAHKDGNRKKDDQSFSLEGKDLFVFRKEVRGDYRFAWMTDTVVDGRRTRRFSAVPRIPGNGKFFAEYGICGDSTDVAYAQLRPAKYPKMVKHMDMALRFFHDGDGHYFLKDVRTRFTASLVIKKIRMEIAEAYSDILY
jgi:hypothetical protein